MNVLAPAEPRQNRILAALPIAEFERLESDLERVALIRGQTLYSPGEAPSHVYFPCTAIISKVFTTANGSSAELAMIGRDGIVGLPLILGGLTSAHKAIVQGEGAAFRLSAHIARWEFDQHGSLQRLCLCFTQALMTQIAQGVVCNRHHSVGQQLSRWLLLTLDLSSNGQVNMTHERIAGMLGVRREAVSEAAGKLQAEGIIHYRRGHITVTDRVRLEAHACECYQVVKAEYDRLFELSLQPLPHARIRCNTATLRQRAEAQLAQHASAANVPRSQQDDPARLMHELQVHQIELEMSNEALREAYDAADALHRKYADLYDFAPIPYLTLDEQGVIIDLNLNASILLGIQRSTTRPYRFSAFIKPEFLPVFNRFFDEKLRGHCRRTCEVVLTTSPHRPETKVVIQAVADEHGRECRMALMDVASTRPIAHERRHHPGSTPPDIATHATENAFPEATSHPVPSDACRHER